MRIKFLKRVGAGIGSLAACSAMIGACSSNTGTSDVKVLNGKATTGYPAVVKLSRTGSNEICTGVFVSKTTLLTAAHCIGKNADGAFDQTGGLAIADTGEKSVRMIAWNVNTGDDKKYPLDFKAWRDLAVVEFAQNDSRSFEQLLITSENKADAGLAPGAAATMVGFGYNKGYDASIAGNEIGIKREGTNIINKIEGGVIKIIGVLKIRGNEGENALVTPGDSGGPLYIVKGDQRYLVGITSAAVMYDVKGVFTQDKAAANSVETRFVDLSGDLSVWLMKYAVNGKNLKAADQPLILADIPAYNAALGQTLDLPIDPVDADTVDGELLCGGGLGGFGNDGGRDPIFNGQVCNQFGDFDNRLGRDNFGQGGRNQSNRGGFDQFNQFGGFDARRDQCGFFGRNDNFFLAKKRGGGKRGSRRISFNRNQRDQSFQDFCECGFGDNGGFGGGNNPTPTPTTGPSKGPTIPTDVRSDLQQGCLGAGCHDTQAPKFDLSNFTAESAAAAVRRISNGTMPIGGRTLQNRDAVLQYLGSVK